MCEMIGLLKTKPGMSLEKFMWYCVKRYAPHALHAAPK